MYLHKFKSFQELSNAVEEYIHFYNYERYQKKLDGLAPMEFRNQATKIALGFIFLTVYLTGSSSVCGVLLFSVITKAGTNKGQRFL